MRLDALFATLSGYLAVFGVLDRPQTPQTRDYVVEHVRIPGGEKGVVLDGELTLPKGSGKVPGLVLITGSGPQNKNEEIVGHKPFLVLSDHLTNAGYGVLRYDDRGVGKSTGDHSAATPTDLAADAAAAMTYLKSHPRILPTTTGYLGHSEGGYLAPRAHEVSRSAFQIYLAGPALPLVPDVMLAQTVDITLAEGGTQADADREERLVRALTELLKTATSPEEVRVKLTESLKQHGAKKKDIQANLSVWATPWALEYAHYQPAETFKELEVPVLALFGGKDLQVAANANADKMRSFLTHPVSEVDILSGLNHLFQPTKTGKVSEYLTIKTTIDPLALNRITSWLDYVTGKSGDLKSGAKDAN
ncbi:alpha/beta hydrolase [Roseibium sp.]|uniref:alpha/beta hydrolase n=1 Tax=Roseibium sp. TaxID=1936156 RepID=UPI003B521684